MKQTCLLRDVIDPEALRRYLKKTPRHLALQRRVAREQAAFIEKQAKRTPEQVAFEKRSTRAGDDAFHQRMREHQDADFAFMRGMK